MIVAAIRSARNSRPVLAATLFAAVLATLVVIVRWESQRRGIWVVSMQNVPEGALFRAVARNCPDLARETVVPGRRWKHESTKMTRHSLAPDRGRTLFYDETVLPGRWTFEVDGFHVDLRESRLDIVPSERLAE